MRKFAGVIVFAAFLALLCHSTVQAKTRLTDEEKLEKGWIVSRIEYADSENSIAVLDVKALINRSPGEVWRFLTDIGKWSSWMPMMSHGWALNGKTMEHVGALPDKTQAVYNLVSNSKPVSVEIKNDGETEVDMFEEYDLPWPISNDWDVRKYIFNSSDAGNSLYSATWKQLFKDARGCGGMWTLERHNGDKNETLLEYHYRVKRKEWVPAKIFEIIIGKTVDRFINAIRRNVAG